MTLELLVWLLIMGCAIFLAYHVLLYVETSVPIVCLRKKYLKNLISEIKIDRNSVVYELSPFAFRLLQT